MKASKNSIFVIRKIRRIVWSVAFASYVPWILVSKCLWSRPTLGQSLGLGILGAIGTALVVAFAFAALESLVRLLSTDDEIRRLARQSGLPQN